jgi:G protein-coupled receptor kinase
VFKKDTGAPMATKKMMKPIIKDKKMIGDACIERSVLEKVNSRFLVNLLYAWQDNLWVGLVLTLCPGGDLAFQIGQHYPMNKDSQGKNVPDKSKPFKGFDKEVLKMYIASMAEGLQGMHSAGFVYRDLKPQNVLLDIHGQVKMSDMGLVADISKGAIKQCSGTRGYWSPETIKKEEYTVHPDWWSLGVTAFVLFSDRLPFHGEPEEQDAATCKGHIEFKHNEPPELQSLITALCTVDPKARLGANGLDEIKKHEYFNGFDWAALEAGTNKVGLVPDPNEINAPTRDEVAGFKAPDGVTWNDDDQKNFASWDYAGEVGWHNEAVKLLEKNKELEGGVATGGGGGCCTIA